MSIYRKDYYKAVTANTEDYNIEVIPNGETWEIVSWNGSANPNRDTHVCLIWDYDTENAEIIALTYLSEKRDINRQFAGDGTKKFAIVLVNDSGEAEKLGAGFIYQVI